MVITIVVRWVKLFRMVYELWLTLGHNLIHWQFFAWSQLTGTLTPAKFVRDGGQVFHRTEPEFSNMSWAVTIDVDVFRMFQDWNHAVSSLGLPLPFEFAHDSSGSGTILAGLEPVNWLWKFARNCLPCGIGLPTVQPIQKNVRWAWRSTSFSCDWVAAIQGSGPMHRRGRFCVGQGPPQPLVHPQHSWKMTRMSRNGCSLFAFRPSQASKEPKWAFSFWGTP